VARTIAERDAARLATVKATVEHHREIADTD
jgi:hypothetical protein